MGSVQSLARAVLRCLVTPLVLAPVALPLRAQVSATAEQQVVGSTTEPGDEFGASVAMNFERALVGAPGHDASGQEDAGAAYVLTLIGNTWVEEAILAADSPAMLEQFGHAVELDGELAVVGAPGAVTSGGATGAAYVFVRSGTSWSQEARLAPLDGTSGARFGQDVAISGSTVLVGASEQAGRGAAYVFVRAGTTWTQQAKLVGPDTLPGDELGFALDLDGDVAVVGARKKDVPGNFQDAGSAYVFERSGTAWSLTVQVAGTRVPQGCFGSAVALYEDRFLIGSPGLPDRVYSYRRSGTTWSWAGNVLAPPGTIRIGEALDLHGTSSVLGLRLTQSMGGALYTDLTPGVEPAGITVTPSDALAGEQFGSSVAVFGNRLLVGARFDGGGGPEAGAAYFYRMIREPVPRYQEQTLLPADLEPGDRLGTSVAADGDRVVVGARHHDVDGLSNSGAAYVYRRQGSAFVLEAKLQSGNPSVEDNFGNAVAIDGDMIAVGANREGAGPQDSRWGAIYIFVRAGTTWTQQAVLLSPEPTGFDRFGDSVDLQGNTVVVGETRGEGPSTDSGTAYVFVRSGTTWALEAQLLHERATGEDYFGEAVALDGDRAIVGAPREDGPVGPRQGAIYVFERQGSSWTQVERLVGDSIGAQLGESVDIEGTTIVAGAPGLSSAIVFRRSGATWAEVERIQAQNGPDTLGRTVRIDAGTLALAGASPYYGFVYLYRPIGSTWLLQAKLVGDDTGYRDEFGRALALSGSTVVVGAELHDVPEDDGGAAYLFDSTSLFASFCNDTDASLASCPCGNTGSPESGCDLQQGTGGVHLDVLSQELLPQNRVTATGTGYPAASAPLSVVIRSSELDPARPVVFGDGLRCVGVPIVRLGATFAAAGTSIHEFGHGSVPGDHYYQLWFRNQPAMFCTPDAFNLSNGRVLSW